MSKKTIILGVLLILWMGFIFIMSNDSGSNSDSDSKDIVTYIIEKYDKITHASGDTINYHHSSEFLDKANLIFRKICHFTEYFILSIIALCLFISFNKYSLLKCNIYSIMFSISYAITDEIHQIFVSDRSGNVIDVLIDSSGAIIGSVIISLIVIIIRKNNEKKELENV